MKIITLNTTSGKVNVNTLQVCAYKASNSGTTISLPNTTLHVTESEKEVTKLLTGKKTTAVRTSKRFVKPTVEEVEAYCKERDNGINAQSFINHYDTNNWMRGNTPVKDWKACVRTWEQRRTDEQKGGPKNEQTDFSFLDE